MRVKIARFNVIRDQVWMLDAPDAVRGDGQWQAARVHTFATASVCCSYLSWTLLRDPQRVTPG